jgi:hypothetical protein
MERDSKTLGANPRNNGLAEKAYGHVPVTGVQARIAFSVCAVIAEAAEFGRRQTQSKRGEMLCAG